MGFAGSAANADAVAIATKRPQASRSEIDMEETRLVEDRETQRDQANVTENDSGKGPPA